MSKFSDEYVELCRKLALPRKWQPGDWAWGTTIPMMMWQYGSDGWTNPVAEVEPLTCWLPLVGDWLEKFREERIPLTLRLMYDEHGEPFWFGIAPETKGLANHQEQGGDPALVLCRLYMAVKHLPALDALAQEGRG